MQATLQVNRPPPPGFDHLPSPNHSYGSDASQTSSREARGQSPCFPSSHSHTSLGSSHGGPQEDTLAALLGTTQWPPATSPPPPGFGPAPQARPGSRPDSAASNGWGAAAHMDAYLPSTPAANGYLLHEQASVYPLSAPPMPGKPAFGSYQDGQRNGYPHHGTPQAAGSGGWPAGGHLGNRYQPDSRAPSVGSQLAGSARPPPGMGPPTGHAAGQPYPPQQLLLACGPVPRRSRSRFDFAQGDSPPESPLCAQHPAPHPRMPQAASSRPSNGWGYSGSGPSIGPDALLHTLLAGGAPICSFSSPILQVAAFSVIMADSANTHLHVECNTELHLWIPLGLRWWLMMTSRMQFAGSTG